MALIRISVDLAFEISNRHQAETLRDSLIPFTQYAVNINEGQPNEEIGFIQAENCRHDENPPQQCEIIARWEVVRGRVI